LATDFHVPERNAFELVASLERSLINDSVQIAKAFLENERAETARRAKMAPPENNRTSGARLASEPRYR
jgi:hypothetical protein